MYTSLGLYFYMCTTIIIINIIKIYSDRITKYVRILQKKEGSEVNITVF